jgi:hypothetical protein
MGEMRNTKFRSENLKGRDVFRNISVEARIILEWILKKYGVKLLTGFI